MFDLIDEDDTWRRMDNSSTPFFNWWSTFYKKGGLCAALITRSSPENDYKGKWIPLSCNKRLSFACRIDKGISA